LAPAPFSGSIVAIVTPMTGGGEIDFAAWETLLRFHVENSTDGVVVGGTTGESPTVSAAELAALSKVAVRVLRGRIPVIAGAGSNSTAIAVERARELSRLGVDGLLAVTPYYNKPPQRGLVEHFRAIATAASVPVLVYNVPSRTAVDLLPATVAELAGVAKIAGIKEATGSVERAREIRALCPPSFVILSGDDATAVDLMEAGATGVISVTANVAPRLMHDVCAACAAGDLRRARELDAQLRGLHQNLFVEANPIPVKWALHRMALIPPGLRLPLVPLERRHEAIVHASLQQAGVLGH
jgi:4-hydroxy-tetrahydrodipicolinate synthase